MKSFVMMSLLAGVLSVNSYAQTQNGAKHDMQTLKVDITDTRIDVISDIIYSQITTGRSNRQLNMTLLKPQTDGAKPAIVYYGAVENQWRYPYSIAILKRKNLLSVTPRRFALKSFIFALNDSAAALDERLL